MRRALPWVLVSLGMLLAGSLGPLAYKVLTEETPKFVAWLQQSHPEIEEQYRNGIIGMPMRFSWFTDEVE